MIRIEQTEVVGWEAAIRGMRNPMNSWDKSDSKHEAAENRIIMKNMTMELLSNGDKFTIGPNDLTLMKTLAQAGTDHRKFMRMIVVYCDITAPLYWWKEFDTYKVGTVANSCSTMHKIHEKRLTMEDFSHEKLVNELLTEIEPGVVATLNIQSTNMLMVTIGVLNAAREMYLKTKDKKYFETMIQLLPTSYNQKRTVMLNYEVLCNIYKSRKNHKLDEWREMCRWIETLPYSGLITGKEGEADG